LYYIIIPATRFGPIVGASSGWSLNRWSVQLIMFSIYEISCPVKINVRITVVQFPLQVFVFVGATLTSICNFQCTSKSKALSIVHCTCSKSSL